MNILLAPALCTYIFDRKLSYFEEKELTETWNDYGTFVKVSKYRKYFLKNMLAQSELVCQSRTSKSIISWNQIHNVFKNKCLKHKTKNIDGKCCVQLQWKAEL